MTEHIDIQRLNSNQVMSAVTIHNQTVYLSGQVPDSTSLDIRGQTLEVLMKIDQLLKLAGTDKSRLLSAQLFVKTWKTFKPSMRSGLNGSRDGYTSTRNHSGGFGESRLVN